MTAQLYRLYLSRQLFVNWTKREFRVRYSQALLGIAWAVVQPIAYMAITTIVFSTLLRLPTYNIPYPVYVYSGLLAWNLFAGGVSAAFPSVADNINIVGKVAFPREVLPLSAICVSLLDFAIASIVFVILLFAFQIRIGWTVVFIPFVLLVQVALIMGISLLCSAMHVRYRDTRFLVPIALQLLFFITPIFYSTETIPLQYQWLFFINPMANIVNAYRGLVFFNQLPDLASAAYTSVFALVALAAGYFVFKRAEGKFADLA